MFCKYCGKQIREDSIFCEFCGGRLVDMPNQADPSSQAGVPDQAEGTFYQGYQQPDEVTQGQGYQPQAESPKSGKRGLLIAGLVVAVCVVVGICVGIVFLLQSQKGSEDETAVAHQINEAIAAAEQVVKSSQEKMLLAAQEKQAQEEAAAKEAAEREAAEKEAAERAAAEKEAAEREAAERQRLAEEEARKNAWKEAYLGWRIPEVFCYTEPENRYPLMGEDTVYIVSYCKNNSMVVENVLEYCKGVSAIGTKLVQRSGGTRSDDYEIFFLDETGKLQLSGTADIGYGSDSDIEPSAEYRVNQKSVTHEEFDLFWEEIYREEGVSRDQEEVIRTGYRLGLGEQLSYEELISAIQNY